MFGTVGYTRKVGDKLGQWVTLLPYPPVSLLTHDQKRQGTFQIPFLPALRITFNHEDLGELGKKKEKKTKEEKSVLRHTHIPGVLEIQSKSYHMLCEFPISEL